MMMRILGIDLGTSGSAAAVLIDGKVQLVASPDMYKSAKPFPSVVSFFEDGGCLIGTHALEQAAYNPHGTVSNVKREMGTGRRIEAFGKKFTPQFISALFLMKIKVDAEAFLNEKITKAVIAIPANFNDIQRQATIDAGQIAGLDVVRLLPEPIAAAMAYGLNCVREPSKILVFDMGAGTLDVSVIEVDSGFFEVVSTAGSTRLGGIDMDAVIAEWLLEEIAKQHDGGKKPTDKQSLAHVNEIANKIKLGLSEQDKVSFDEEVGGAFKISGKIARTTFNELIGGLLGKCRDVIISALDGAGLRPVDIDKAVMVGGPSKVPAIHQLLSETVREPEQGIDPYFAVATGAAIEGGVLANDENLPELYQGLTLLGVTPLDLAEEAQKDGVIKPIVMIPKNTPYPTSYTRTFYVNKIMQTEVKIGVWQGDFEMNQGFIGNVSLGAFTLSGLQPACQNEVEVTYEIDSDGILTVHAKEVGTDTEYELVIERTWEQEGVVAELGYEDPEQYEDDIKGVRSHESRYRDVMSPYEIPIEEYNIKSAGGDAGMSWMCQCLAEAKNIIKAHHTDLNPTFFDASKFELFLQEDMQYAYAYIRLSGGSVYQIGIHPSFVGHTRENQRSLVVTLVHELLHAIHPEWGHNKIRPEERKMANLAGYFDTYVEKERMFLGGRMSFCNNVTMNGSGRRIWCG